MFIIAFMNKKKNIPFSIPYINDEEINEVVKILKGKWITSGAEVTLFETKIKECLGVNTAVAVSSGTAALDIALAVQLKENGEEILTTAYTFVSTVLSILHRHAHPVFADIDPHTFNLCPNSIMEIIQRNYLFINGQLISKASGRKLSGILPVHFAGQAADMLRINEIARTYNLFVIEDAAHALGAEYQGSKIGKSANLVCFSFYSNKNITSGEGGMIVTDNSEIEDNLRMYSLHGMSKNAANRYKTGMLFYDVAFPGFKANMSDVLAAIGVAQLNKFSEILKKRKQIAAWYDYYLQDIAEVELPFIKPECASSRHLYPMLLRKEIASWRNEIIDSLKSKGIFPSVHFIPVYQFSFFRQLSPVEIHLPNTDDLFLREISLPIYPDLTQDDIHYIAVNLKKIIAKKKLVC
jgi:perosamine synthetase